MPMSHPYNRKPIAQIIQKYNCKTALDIGIGYGNIGTYLTSIFPQLIIDGIEIWEPYNNPQWASYREIWIADFTYVHIKPIYDAILAIDMIEHLPKTIALRQILRLMKLAQKVFILCLPIVEYPQGGFMGNPYETHLSSWRESEILAMGLKLVAKNEVIGIFIGRKHETMV